MLTGIHFILTYTCNFECDHCFLYCSPHLEVSDDAFHHGEEFHNSAKQAAAAAEQIGQQVKTICIKPPEVKPGIEKEKGNPIYLGGPKLRGRAVEKLSPDLPTKSWEPFTSCPLEDLRNPKRVHLDPFGNVHLCQGLTMGNLWEIPFSELLKTYDPDQHPLCSPILKGGPAQLVKEYNLPHEEEYVDACHLCSKMCLALINQFPEYLAPRQVYGLE